MSDSNSKKLHKQGVALFRKGKYDTALIKLEEALEQAKDGSKAAAEIYNDIGVVYKQLEDYQAAHQALDKAEAYFIELDNQKGQAQVFGNRASVYEAESMFDEAIESYKKSANILEELDESEMAMYAWQAVSKLRTKQGQYIAAIGAYEEGIDNMPDGSFKKKILRQILKAPGTMLGGLGRVSNQEKDE